MSTLFYKELRENLRWAIFGMVALAAFMIWAMKNASAPELLGDSFFFATISGFSALGMAIGLLQIFQDRLRSREAFIIHRPVQRSTVFAAKVLAGVILYFASAGIPLLLALWWCYAHRYQTAPFEWRMAQPSIWDLLNGTIVYFAALLIGTRDARWFGSRLMPLVIPFLAIGTGWLFAINFGEAAIISAIGLLILMPTARSSFIRDGQFQDQPLFIRSIETVTIALGIGVCLIFACNFVLDSSGLLPDGTKVSWWNYEIDEEGHLFRKEYENGNLQRTKDLAGNIVPNLPDYNLHYVSFGLPPKYESSFRFTHHPSKSFHQRESYLRQFHFEGSDSSNEELNYSVHRRVIEEFNVATGRWIGTIGQDGFVESPRPARPFELPLFESSYYGAYLYDDKNVYRIGMEPKRLKVLLSVSGDERVGGVVRFGKLSDRDSPPQYLAILTNQYLRVYEGENERFTIQPPFRSPTYRYVGITALNNGNFALFYSSPDSDIDAAAPTRLVVLDPQGKVIRQIEAPAPKYRQFPWWQRVTPQIPSPALLLALAGLTAETPPPATAIVAICALAILSGLAAAWRMKKYSFTATERVTWIVFSALMGVPGFVTLLSMRDWPARIVCHHCNKRRLVTRESCEHCGAPQATPKLEGIEIFETAVA